MDAVLFKDSRSKLEFIGAGDTDDAFIVVLLEYFPDAGCTWQHVDVVLPLR